MGGRGSRSGMGGATSSNTFKSAYGLPNVGTRETFTSTGGTATVGTVTPTVNDVQAYFDTGSFDNYGTNAGAKRQMASKIAQDMNGRGFEVSVSEDGTKLLPGGDTGKTIIFGRSGGQWKAKSSSSSGTRERGGMKGALGRAGKTRR